MSDAIIAVENLGKKYSLRHHVSQDGLRHILQDRLTAPFRRLCRSDKATDAARNGKKEDFWALKDVTFDVRRGEVIGIIGRNGAGKSTLLKILSRITDPTEGKVHIKGRVASLLEVGTGFHPELSGRENVFLNGAILGMGRNEIKKKFDEIVAFAETEKFLDTPVKRYSSGMYVRLAFAVAAHLEPEILIVDEVLAVGDASFQKKCLGKMSEVANQGRTVLFVSHNIAAITQLTRSCLWLDCGNLVLRGKSSHVVSKYLRKVTASAENEERVFEEDLRKQVQVLRACISNERGQNAQRFSCDEPVVIVLTMAVRKKTRGLYGYLQIDRADGFEVMVSDTDDFPPNRFDALDPGVYEIRVALPPRSLGHGNYSVYLNFNDNREEQNPNVAGPGYVCSFALDDFSSKRGNCRGGFFSTLLAWDLNPVSERSLTNNAA